MSVEYNTAYLFVVSLCALSLTSPCDGDLLGLASKAFHVYLTGCDARVAQLEWNCTSTSGHVTSSPSSPAERYIIEYRTSFDDLTTTDETWRVAKVTSMSLTSSARQGSRRQPHRRGGSGNCVERIAVSPGASYMFRVTLLGTDPDTSPVSRINGLTPLHGTPSHPTSDWCRTPPDVPHLNPRGVCTFNTRPGTLHIVWQPMTREEQNGPGFHYVIRWRLRHPPIHHDATVALTTATTNQNASMPSSPVVGKGHPRGRRRKPDGNGAESIEQLRDGMFEENTVNSTQRELLVERQPIYAEYEIYVSVANDVGPAVASPRLVQGYSGEDEPLETPRHFRLHPNRHVTSSTADFLWSPVDPKSTLMNGFFTGYKLQYWKTSDVMADESMKEHSIIYSEPSSCWRYSVTSRDQRSLASWSRSLDDSEDDRTTRDVTRNRYPKHVDSGNRLRPKSNNSTANHLQMIRLQPQQPEIFDDADDLLPIPASSLPSSSHTGNSALATALHVRIYDLWPYTNISIRLSVLNTNIYDLWPYTNISIRLSVLNTKFQGPPTDVITFMTAESVPEAVRDLNVVGRGSLHIHIVWQKPAAINGQLIGYTVSYQLLTSSTTRKTPSSHQSRHIHQSQQHQDDLYETKYFTINDTSSTSAKVTSLLPGRPYRVGVAARTGVGMGPVSHVETRTQPFAIPLFVPSFVTETVGDGLVNVSWLWPSTIVDIQNAISVSVHYRKQGHSIWTVSKSAQSAQLIDANMATFNDTSVALTSTSTVIGGLDPGVVYEIRLAVWQDNGGPVASLNGPPSTAPISTGPVQLVRVGHDPRKKFDGASEDGSWEQATLQLKESVQRHHLRLTPTAAVPSYDNVIYRRKDGSSRRVNRLYETSSLQNVASDQYGGDHDQRVESKDDYYANDDELIDESNADLHSSSSSSSSMPSTCRCIYSTFIAAFITALKHNMNIC